MAYKSCQGMRLNVGKKYQNEYLQVIFDYIRSQQIFWGLVGLLAKIDMSQKNKPPINGSVSTSTFLILSVSFLLTFFNIQLSVNI